MNALFKKSDRKVKFFAIVRRKQCKLTSIYFLLPEEYPLLTSKRGKTFNFPHRFGKTVVDTTRDQKGELFTNHSCMMSFRVLSHLYEGCETLQAM